MKNIIMSLFVFFFNSLIFAETITSEQIKPLQDLIDGMMVDSKIPGMTVAIFDENNILYSNAFGYKDLEKQIPMTTSTLFAIGSATKSFTAFLAAQEIEKGTLNLDRPIKDMYSDFKMWSEEATQQVTLRHMLSHRTGLPRHDFVWYGQNITRERIYENLQHLETSNPVNFTAEYNNIIYAMVGHLLEKKNNRTWESQVTEGIFAPLGMNNTFASFDLVNDKDAITSSYIKIQKNIQNVPFRNVSSIGPAGSIISNVHDLAKWGQLQLNQGRNMLDLEMYAEMIKPQTASSFYPLNFISDLSPEHYGLGWFLHQYKGEPMIHHNGAIDGFMSQIAILPNQKRGIVVLSNLGGNVAPLMIAHAYFDLVLNSPMKPWRNILKIINSRMEQTSQPVPKPINPDRLALSEFVGTYHHPAYGTINITLQNNRLHSDHPIFGGYIGHLSDQVYYQMLDNSTIDENAPILQFYINNENKVESFYMPLENNVNAIEFKKL